MRATSGTRSIEEGRTVQCVLDVLHDADCRAILRATGETALSANEVAEACDLAQSTAYRKLDMLTDAGLVEERTRLRRSGKHASEYVRAVEDVAVSFDADGVQLRLSPSERSDDRGRRGT
ncbi:MAG: helix-turn-helix domain-containing protein [Haloferacaceae archaeon]